MTEDQIHQNAIQNIINNHFVQAENRIEPICSSYFYSFREIIKRHWKNKKDIPNDLASIPRHSWNFVAKKVFKKNIKSLPKSGKVKEIESIISNQLLDLSGLEKEIEDYLIPYQQEFEKSLSDILESVPVPDRGKYANMLESEIEKLTTPIEGCRDAVMFLVAGIVGKVFSDKIVFGSMLSTGKAIATSIYMSQLSWFGALWANIFGIPAWIGVAGAIGGMAAGIIVAPLVSPLFEFGINRLRAKKILTEIVRSAEEKLTVAGKDAFNVAGKIAIYLQVFPDILHIAKKTAKVFI